MSPIANIELRTKISNRSDGRIETKMESERKSDGFKKPFKNNFFNNQPKPENKDIVFGIQSVLETLRSGKEIDKILVQRELGSLEVMEAAMGIRGPAPTPTPILALHGSWRAKTRAGEPRPPQGKPQRPSTRAQTCSATT